MSARLTPERVADRELARIDERRSRLYAELQDLDEERARWEAVLSALNGSHRDDEQE